MINTADNTRSTTLHELQHAVQQREGFARGGSPEGLPEALGNDAKALRTKANQLLAQGNRPEALALEKQARQLDSQIVWGSHAPQELYRRLAGESEARLTQSRMDMTGAERAANYPPSMYDVPVGDQIVRYGDGPALATTWHGSPHKFEPTELNDLGEFNAAKIGTGEGAQAYSHGHYTGEARGTGEGYQNAGYNGFMLDGEIVHPTTTKGAKEYAAAALSRFPDKKEAMAWVGDSNMAKEVNAIIRKTKEFGENPGHLYKVDIPDEHIAQMLDWDKPLSEQSEQIQEYAKSQLANEIKGAKSGADGWGDLSQPYDVLSEMTGRDLVSKLRPNLNLSLQNITGGGGPEVSNALRNAGIPGVRYLDAGSRGAEGGTSNFVVFPGNEHMMTILERNGQAMSPESQAIARYREIKGPKSVVRMEAALRTAGVPLPKNEPVAYIQGLVDRAHRRN